MKTTPETIADYKNVWTFAEVRREKLEPVSFELLNIGKQLASSLKSELCAVLIGYNVKQFANALIERGAQKVYVIDDKIFENFIDDTFGKALADLINEHKPDKFILPATTMGRSLSAQTAIYAHTGLTADATEIVIDGATGQMHATRPTFGGNLMATIRCAVNRPEMVSLRPLTYPQAQANPENKGEIIEFKVEPSKYASKAVFKEYVPEEAGETDIKSAEIIVSGGRALQNGENFAMLKELAHLLGGSVAASRAAVDSGWITYRHQVGLTGATVKPKLYIAAGISGQIQHLAGMGSSDTIVAINKDPNAPIMQRAHYSVEGDLFEVIPELIKLIKQRRENK